MTTVCTLLLVTSLPLGQAPSKKLIQWGAGSPDARQFREQIEVFEKSAFDGTVISATGKDGDKSIDLAWQAFSTTVFKREHFAEAVKDLQAAEPRRFTENFLRFNDTPGGVDFFDDAGWAAIVNNAKVAAWVARQGGLKGWMFDTEQYEKQQFKYHDQRDAKTRSFTEYTAAARRRGNEFMRAVNSEFSDITILFTFAHTLMAGDWNRLPDALYGLLPPFIDGMLEASTDKTVFVDAMEFAYPAKTRKEFEFLHVHVHVGGKNLSAVQDIYEKKMRVGFGIWLDYDWRTKGWDPKDPAKNHFKPDELHEALRLALEISDRYVWLYSEKANWWTGANLSEAYVKAVMDARAGTATQSAPAAGLKKATKPAG
jgi:hypothetical protein